MHWNRVNTGFGPVPTEPKMASYFSMALAIPGKQAKLSGYMCKVLSE